MNAQFRTQIIRCMTSMGMHSEQVLDLDLMAMIQEQVGVVG